MMDTKLSIIPPDQWCNCSLPLFISGPCSAESKKQVLETAEALALIPHISVFRAGIWKPRTRPNEFEGVGEKGLKWLQKVKEQTRLLIAVEIGTTEHIKSCLDHGVDILWIGARTVVNPFSIKEIAKVLQGKDLPVMIKNPVNPDLNLWIGAIERINQAGIRKIVAIHRGFDTTSEITYRNEPLWELPIELKRKFPNLPIICDPSHICGNTKLIPEIAQKAFDLGMDGLMIEAHIDPKKALTDREQQLSPRQLIRIMENLEIRVSGTGSIFEENLEHFRTYIDQVDADLLEILNKRMEIIKKIGAYKKKHNLSAFQVKRWDDIRSRFLKRGKHLGLDEEFLIRILEMIHQESIQIQSKVFREKKD